MPTWSDVLKSLLVAHEQLVIGWLLGLLAPAVVETIRQGRRVKLLGRALAQELHELQYHMAVKAYVFRNRTKLDDEFLLWFEAIAAGYKGQEPVKPFLEMLPQLRKIDVSQRNQFDPKRGLSLSEGEAPLLHIHTNEIALFSVASQVWLLNVAKNLSFYNQQVSYLRRIFEKTFDDLTETNRKIVRQNLEDGYQQLAQRSIHIADLIKSAPPSLRA